MTAQHVFLFKPYKRFDQHTVINFDMDGVDRKELQELITSGDAIEVSFGAYDEYRNKAKQLHSDYLKAEKRIKESDNPLHNQEYKDYELKKAYAEYEQGTKALQAEWTEKRKEMQAEARAKAARATVSVSQSDKATAEQIADRLALSIAGVQYAKEINEVVEQAAVDFSYLSDGQKTAIQSKLPGILALVEAKADKYGVKVNTAGLVNSVKDIRNMDLLSAKVAKHLPSTITDEFSTKDLVKNARNGKRPSLIRPAGRK